VTRRGKIVLRVLAGAAILLPLSGWLYEQAAAARDARRFPPPGRLVDIGGRRLHLLCIGSGRPIVLFEASGFSNSASSSDARSSLARQTTVCSYDRAGVGWSDPGPATISIGELADDLRRLQDSAGLPSPLVIVTSSMGGWVSELFARRYPDRVAGLVFLDAGNSETLALADSLVDARTLFEVKTACVVLNSAGRVGLVRMADPFGFRLESSAAAERSAALMYGAQQWRALCAAVRGVAKSLDEFARAPALRADVPLVVLSAERSDNLLPPPGLLPANLRGVEVARLLTRLKETSQHLAQRSTRGSWRLVRDSGHLIASDRPAEVVAAVLELLNQVRGVATTAPHS
jgi:pimeloyl-ACP methyl ester carboxylesterase